MMADYPVKVLQINAENFGSGGISVVIWRLMEQLKDKNIQASYLCQRKYVDEKYVKEIRMQGGEVQYIKTSSNPILRYFDRYIKCDKVIREHHYDIVHINGNESFGIISYVMAAKKNHCRVAVHAHSTSFMNKDHIRIKRALKAFFQIFLLRKADCLLACSKEAARFMYGKKADRAVIVKNGLEPEKYCYDHAGRSQIRSEYKCGSKIIIGHVGRFVYAKNHEFIVNVFEHLQKNYPNSELWLIGENQGSGYETIYSQVKTKGLQDKVRFIGNTDRIGEYLSAMDVLLFPSRFEGLPLVLVEAQVNGLPIVCSDIITDEAFFSSSVRKLSLNDALSVWTDQLIKLGSQKRNHVTHQEIAESGFDIADVAEIVLYEYKKMLIIHREKKQGIR